MMDTLKNSKIQIILTISFVLGIVVAEKLTPNFLVSFTFWVTALSSMVIVMLSGKSVFQFRNLKGLLFALVFFFSGWMGITLQHSSNQKKHFTKYHLPGDQLLIDVIDFQEGEGKFHKAVGEVVAVVNEKTSVPVSGKVVCYFPSTENRASVGTRWQVASELNKIENKNNPGEFDQVTFWKSKGVEHTVFSKDEQLEYIGFFYSTTVFWDRLRNYLKTQLKQYLDEGHYSVAIALSLGDKSELSKETRGAFATAGAMHVLAVSGLHVGILLAIIQWVCFRVSFLRKRNLYIYISIVVIWFFAFLTGLSPSVFRAATMFSILAIGQLRGKSILSLSSLLMSGLLLLIINPSYLFDIGFQLSYLAMIGIVFFYAPVSQLFYFKKKWVNFIWDGVAIGIAAQIGTLPISLYYFHQFPNYFVLTNIGFLALGFLALGSVLLFFVLHAIPVLAIGAAYIVKGVFETVIQFVGLIEQLPISLATGFELSILQVIVAYVLIFGTWYVGKQVHLKRWRFFAVLSISFALFLQVVRWGNQFNEELVVLNHYYQTIVWKKGNEAICLYDYRAKGKEDKILFQLESYEKLKGVKVEMYPMPTLEDEENSIEFRLNNSELQISTSKYVTRLIHNGQTFWFPNRNIPNLVNRENVVVGPWLRNSEQLDTFNANQGAVRLVL